MNHAPENARPRRLTRLRQWMTQWLPLLALAVLVFALALAVLAAGIAWLIHHPDVVSVVGERAAGRVQRVELHGGLFSRALVETDTGFYALEEGVSLNKGEPLTVQERANRSRHLCDTQQRCTRLLRPWP